MRRDSRLSVALHVLLHMEELGPVVTSEAIGRLMEANPVVVRRTMAGLRKAGIMRSEKGHGGGWSLARKLDAVTLADVYEALGTPAVFSIGPRHESPGCLVEQAVNGALGKALGEAEALFMKQLRGLSVADLGKQVQRSHARSTKKGSHPHG
ncbi:Rrf2 family transcriptional regulator [Pyxidicoccus fallax]|uniref:Rrf2 family transcriptional regulator n=1 Tax=Pyxidicoccus fallax TaxID=394095 RepID=A0A848LGH6_9BACT|nr:Rrf2 family transcriptional regulator [Pyxidicoccus fallax]NMO15741.1 Rrf2 family transcriptional regulator [Pyxidicoccus fallax]NPC85247.1 Rrf2 family transcriptional regulator [Pyxidicoccus fallax]